MDLEEMRDAIDAVDKKLCDLLSQRMDLSMAVGRYKKAKNLPIFHPDREEEVLAKNVQRMENEAYKLAYRDILQKIMETSRGLQGHLNYDLAADHADLIDWEGLLATASTDLDLDQGPIGYQGIPGSYSQEALVEMTDKPSIETRHYPTFAKAVQALCAKEVESLVLPIENSSMGGVKEVEVLLSAHHLYVVDEYVLTINHALLGIEAGSLDDVRQVLSHSQALGQCAAYLEAHDFLALPYYNTAMSALKVQEDQDQCQAAIASEQAGKLYGLKVLARNIGDNTSNHTRFVRVRRTPRIMPANNKISIRLSMAHESGSLARIVNIMAESGLNMTRIESQPIYGRPWEYYFFIDFEGNILDKVVRKALDRMRENSTDFIFLGNYRKGPDGYRD